MRSTVAEHIDDFVFSPLAQNKPDILILSPQQTKRGLHPVLQRNAPTTWHIKSDEELVQKISVIKKEIKFSHPARTFVSYIDTALKSVSLSETGASVDLSALLHYQPPCAAGTGFPKLVIIDENHIQSNNLAEFISLLQQIPPENIPRIALLAKDDQGLDAQRRVAACGDQVVAKRLSPSGAQRITVDAPHCQNPSQLLESYLKEAYGSCLVSSSNEFGVEPDRERELAECLELVIRIQAYFRSENKFAARPDLNKLSYKISGLESLPWPDDISSVLRGLRVRLNLWDVFLTEMESGKVKSSIDAAHAAGDPLLLAHCLKLSELVYGCSREAEQLLIHAKSIFYSYGEEQHALQVENNINANAFYSAFRDPGPAVALSDYVDHDMPWVRRGTTYHANAGIALLLAGRLDSAIPYFQRASNASGPAVNRLNSQVLLLIARFLDGQDVEEADIVKHVRKLQRANIARGFNYHQSYLYGNLWQLAHKIGAAEAASEIRQHLQEKRYLDYQEYLDSPDRLLGYTLSLIPGANAAQGSGGSTPLHDLDRQTGFIFPAHVFFADY